jgi:DnaJ-class molecular chaperone
MPLPEVKMTYRQLREAMEVFGLGERATLAQIRARYRELAKAHHPDRGRATDPETIRTVTNAYAVLMEYCNRYRYCFSEEEFLAQTPAERIKRQFGWDPVWSAQPEEKPD